VDIPQWIMEITRDKIKLLLNVLRIVHHETSVLRDALVH
jgi:hypothetical protein